eukprot:tig00000178_g12719.t1
MTSSALSLTRAEAAERPGGPWVKYAHAEAPARDGAPPPAAAAAAPAPSTSQNGARLPPIAAGGAGAGAGPSSGAPRHPSSDPGGLRPLALPGRAAAARVGPDHAAPEKHSDSESAAGSKDPPGAADPPKKGPGSDPHHAAPAPKSGFRVWPLTVSSDAAPPSGSPMGLAAGAGDAGGGASASFASDAERDRDREDGGDEDGDGDSGPPLSAEDAREPGGRAVRPGREAPETDRDIESGNLKLKLPKADSRAHPAAGANGKGPSRGRRDKRKRKQKPRNLATRWRDLSMKKKLMALVASTQLLTTLVLTGVVVLVLFLSSSAQLVRQAGSEILTNQIVYDIKNNQMNYGFAGQGDNPSIINAARLGPTAAGPEADAIVRAAKEALVNEIVRRDIEYSSLLSADADPLVIVSSNRDRRGEPMPELRSFTRALIESNKPTRFSLLVSRKELVEGEGAVPKDPSADYFLVRFIGRPVYTGPDQPRPAAILLAGDVVNGKNWTVEPSRAAFKSGYVAVYQRSRPDCASSEPGCFRVSTAMLPEDTEPRLAPLLGAAADGLLEAASSAQPPGSVVTSVLSLAGGEKVTAAAKALQDPSGRSVAFLVRATSHAPSDEVLRIGVLACVASGVFVCVISCWLSWLLLVHILSALRDLKVAVEDFDFLSDSTSCSSSRHSISLPPGKACASRPGRLGLK